MIHSIQTLALISAWAEPENQKQSENTTEKAKQKKQQHKSFLYAHYDLTEPNNLFSNHICIKNPRRDLSSDKFGKKTVGNLTCEVLM